MMLPNKLWKATQNQLKGIKEHPKHYFPATNRKELMTEFYTFESPTSKLAWKWLAILSARHVLPYYVPSDYEKYRGVPRSYDIPEDFRRQFEADYQLEIAEKVLMQQYLASDAYQMACNVHYGVGMYMPLRSQLAHMAANRALVEVSTPDLNSIYDTSISRESFSTDPIIEIFEAAPTAAIASACEIDVEQVDPDAFPETWNWWIKQMPMNSERMLKFWEWYLEEAVLQAWDIAEKTNNEI